MNERDGNPNEKGDGPRSVQKKLGDLAEGFGKRIGKAVDVFESVELAARAIGLGHNQLRRMMKEEAVPSFPTAVRWAWESLTVIPLPRRSRTGSPASIEARKAFE